MEYLTTRLLIIVFLFSFSSCNQNKIIGFKDDLEIETFYVFDTCVTPISSGIIRKYELLEYQPPEFLLTYLDSIVIQEKKCPCYRKQSSGFKVFFRKDDDGYAIISISPLRKLHIGNYEKYTGYFFYNDHYFLCQGSVDSFLLKENMKQSFYAFKPKEINEIEHLGYSIWNFDLTDSIILDSKTICH
jgi:hypothetical protein